jgi:glycosyltransferase involved in cell wall biosynthesis
MTRPAKILVDGYFLGKPYGFGRFIFEMCRALALTKNKNQIVVAIPERSLPISQEVPGNLEWEILPDTIFPIWEQILIPNAARRLSCDVIHFPYNTTAAFTFGKTKITTVHDLIFLDENHSVFETKNFLSSVYSKLCFRAFTKNAQRIVSVSRTTAEHLNKLGIKSDVVYNTIDGFIAGLDKKADLKPNNNYFLHRGGKQIHRNTERVISAFLDLDPARSNIELNIIGIPDGNRYFGLPLDSRVNFLPRVTDNELANLYAGSKGVIATSLQEGFGLPIIEAFGFCVPVITSNLNPMAEIAGDAALLVDPSNKHEIGSAMRRLLQDKELANSLVSRGSRRLEIFSSDVVGTRMTAVYEGLFLDEYTY